MVNGEKMRKTMSPPPCFAAYKMKKMTEMLCTPWGRIALRCLFLSSLCFLSLLWFWCLYSHICQLNPEADLLKFGLFPWLLTQLLALFNQHLQNDATINLISNFYWDFILKCLIVTLVPVRRCKCSNLRKLRTTVPPVGWMSSTFLLVAK